MRAKRTGLLGGALLLAATVMGPAAAAGPAEVTDVGWWSRRPGAAAQPGDGFEIAARVDGDSQSIAALRIRTNGGLTSAQLTLVEAGGVRQDAAALRVCRTDEAWKAADPGGYEDAPAVDCGASVDLTRDDENSRWTGEVGALLPRSGGTASLMVVPGADPAEQLPVGTGFEIQFEPPRLDATAASGGSGPAVAPTTTAYVPPAPAETGGAPAQEPAAPASEPEPVDAGYEAAPADDFDLGAAGASDASDPPAAPSKPAPKPKKAAATPEPISTEDVAAGSSGGGGGGGTDRPWGRLVLIVPLSAAAGAAAIALRRFAQARGVALGASS